MTLEVKISRKVTAGGGGNGAAQNPYAFHAGIKDPGSGLIKFGQRWYNPTAGTSTHQDTPDNPLDPANANRYAYAGDDPINGNDPTGAGACGTASRVGACADNAAMESFFSLPRKIALNKRRWQTREELRLAIVTWIEST